jgi:RNA-binding protein
MPLTISERQQLRTRAHRLKPVVMIGAAGLTPAVLAEFEQALAHHELIKVRVGAEDRTARDVMVAELCAAGAAELVQRIGHVAVLYRPKPPQKETARPKTRRNAVKGRRPEQTTRPRRTSNKSRKI